MVNMVILSLLYFLLFSIKPDILRFLVLVSLPSPISPTVPPTAVVVPVVVFRPATPAPIVRAGWVPMVTTVPTSTTITMVGLSTAVAITPTTMLAPSKVTILVIHIPPPIIAIVTLLTPDPTPVAGNDQLPITLPQGRDEVAGVHLHTFLGEMQPIRFEKI